MCYVIDFVLKIPFLQWFYLLMLVTVFSRFHCHSNFTDKGTKAEEETWSKSNNWKIGKAGFSFRQYRLKTYTSHISDIEHCLSVMEVKVIKGRNKNETQRQLLLCLLCWLPIKVLPFSSMIQYVNKFHIFQ